MRMQGRSVGREIELAVIDVDQNAPPGALAARVGASSAPSCLTRAAPRAIRTGVVHNLWTFGAFVDLGA